ncbi:MAG: flagellar M-ring protein FliF [Rhizobiales bacterium]|nr:flagellar M-ring protein FliF [Hyphomicrobiales bacterium]NRB14117.1 flagellar M-ring protein FliF [Hyphomicrobiales bacterium]
MFEFLQKLGVARVGAMVAVAIGLVGFFGFIMVQVNSPIYVPLYTDLSMRDMQAVVKSLDSKVIPYELKNDGTTIWVPKDSLQKLKMSFASEGLPTGGSVGYEIFDNTDSLGVTSYVQDLNHKRALEGELARTITSLRQVAAARVHLVLPEKKLFSRETAQPTASITIRILGDMDQSTVKSIQYLVSSSVKGLKTSFVAIIDERGRTLASGNGEEAGLGMANSFDERSSAIETRLKKQIEFLVGSVVGDDKVRVKVNADLQLNSITQKTETFDPDGSVVRSTVSSENANNSQNNEGTNAVSVGNELPNAAANSDNGNKSSAAGNSTSETINYEISKTLKTEVIAAGNVKKLSVAVLVDGVYTIDADGKPVYAPRPQAELDKITALVRTAIGFDASRNDVVNVINLQFISNDLVPEEIAEVGIFDFTKQEMFRMAELGTLFFVAIIVLFMVIRPLIRRILSPEDMEQPLLMDPATITHTVNDAGQPVAVLADGTEVSPGVIAAMDKEPKRVKISAKLETALATGDLQSSTIKHVGEIVNNNPDETLSIIRGWLNEGEEERRAVPL